VPAQYFLSCTDKSVGRVEPVQDCQREEIIVSKSEVDSTLSSNVQQAEEPCSNTPFGPSAKLAYSNFISDGTVFESKSEHALSFSPANTERLTRKSTVVDDDELIKDSVMPYKLESKCIHSESLDEKTKGNMFNFQSSFVVPKVKKRTKIPAVDDSEANKVSLVSKCDEFLQSVKKNVESESKKKPISIKEEEKNKNVVGCDIDIGKYNLSFNGYQHELS